METIRDAQAANNLSGLEKALTQLTDLLFYAVESCLICRAALNGASICRRCRANLERAQEIERLGQSLAGAAMHSLAEGDSYSARQWLRRARAVHATSAVWILEQMLAGSAPIHDASDDASFSAGAAW